MTKKSAVEVIDSYIRISTETIENIIPRWQREAARTDLRPETRTSYEQALTCVTAILITRKHNEVKRRPGRSYDVWVCERCGHSVSDPTRLLDWQCESRMGRSRRLK